MDIKLTEVRADFMMADETLLGVYRLQGPAGTPCYLVELRCGDTMGSPQQVKFAKALKEILAKRYAAEIEDFVVVCCTEGMTKDELEQRLTQHYERAAASC